MCNYGTCGGDHPTKKYRITSPLKWCEFCRKMTNHNSSECYFILGYMRGGNNTQMKNQNIPITQQLGKEPGQF